MGSGLDGASAVVSVVVNAGLDGPPEVVSAVSSWTSTSNLAFFVGCSLSISDWFFGGVMTEIWGFWYWRFWYNYSYHEGQLEVIYQEKSIVLLKPQIINNTAVYGRTGLNTLSQKPVD